MDSADIWGGFGRFLAMIWLLEWAHVGYTFPYWPGAPEYQDFADFRGSQDWKRLRVSQGLCVG